MQVEGLAPILRLNDAVLRRLTTFIITPDWDLPKRQGAPGPRPDFLSFFALSQTCRSLRLALVPPDEEEGYWRSILLDVGQGLACKQEPLKFDGEESEPTFRELDSSWAAVARRLAKEAHEEWSAGLYLGRGKVRPVVKASGRSLYYKATREKQARLPGIPSPEVPRVLSHNDASTHSVPINYDAVVAGDDFVDTAPGTFFTRPAVPEVKIFLTFDETSATNLAKICRTMQLPLQELAERLVILLNKSGAPVNSIFNPDEPVVVRNPHGVTTDDVASSLRAWLENVSPRPPLLQLCQELVDLMGMALEESYPEEFDYEEFTEYPWFSTIFARPVKPKQAVRDDWQFLLVNGGVTYVRIGFDSMEVVARVRELEPPINPFDMLLGSLTVQMLVPLPGGHVGPCNCPHCLTHHSLSPPEPDDVD